MATMDWNSRATAAATAALGVAPSETFNALYAYLLTGEAVGLDSWVADEIDAVAMDFDSRVRAADGLAHAGEVLRAAADAASAERLVRPATAMVLNAYNAVLVAAELPPLPGCPNTYVQMRFAVEQADELDDESFSLWVLGCR